ncbi:MAG: two-component regulator propeller domain-containing protein, partial [Bacteroidota bacterium]
MPHRYSWILLICLLLITPLSGRGQPIEFERISNELGLSQNLISAIVQDQQGYLWVGTKDGLNRFDGYSFQVFKHNPSDSTSLSDNYIKALYLDQENRLWIGTLNGLNLYEPESESFRHILPPIDSKSAEAIPNLKHPDINSITQDRLGHFWISTSGSGLCRMSLDGPTDEPRVASLQYFDREDGLGNEVVKYVEEDAAGFLWVNTPTHTTRLFYDAQLDSSHWDAFSFEDFAASWQNRVRDYQRYRNGWVAEDRILGFVKGNDGSIWIITAAGLVNWNPQSGQYHYYPVQELLNDHPIFANSIAGGDGFVDREGKLWFGGHSGLLVFDTQQPFDPATDEYCRVELAIHAKMPDLSDDFSPTIASLFEDQSGVVWLGTNGLGLFKFRPEKRKFTHYDFKGLAPSVPSIRAIAETSDGALWLATTSFRFFRFDRHTVDLTFVDLKDIDRPNYEGLCRSIYIDEASTIWADNNQGLSRISTRNGTILEMSHIPVHDFTEGPTIVYDMQEDFDRNLWIITRNYFGILDPDSGDLDGCVYLPEHLVAPSFGHFPSIYLHSDSTFWLGTISGLKHYDPETKILRSYVHDSSDSLSLSHDIVRCVVADPKQPDKFLWVGTAGGGLNRLDIQTGHFQSWGVEDGLPDDVIYGILADDSGMLWMSTNRGLSQFDPRTYSMRHFTTADGLQDNEFNRGAYFKSESGELFFGGINGLNAFFPEHVQNSTYRPAVVISDFRLSNESTELWKYAVTDSEEDHAYAFELSHREKILTFEFAALDFSAPDQNEYAYRLINFEEEWQYIGQERRATFTNLNPGTYYFEVKGTNSDGVWNDEATSVRIVILPPWWKTWWAYLTYFLVAALILYRINRFQIKRQLEKAEAANIKATDELKTRFYTNITHEFRTPLTVIRGMLSQINGHQEERDIIRRNSNKLLQLIN